MSDLLTPQEAAAIWGCTTSHIYALANDGKLPVAQVAEIVTPTGYRTTKLFRPRDVLDARRAARVSKASRTPPVLTSKAKARQRKVQQAKLRAYYQLPRDQRKRVGAWLKTEVPRGL